MQVLAVPTFKLRGLLQSVDSLGTYRACLHTAVLPHKLPLSGQNDSSHEACHMLKCYWAKGKEDNNYYNDDDPIII